MASIRLPSLWSTVCKSWEVQNPALRSARAAQRSRAYHPSYRWLQEPIPQRYGTANEPPPHLRNISKEADQSTKPSTTETAASKPDEKEVVIEKKQPITLDGGVVTTITPDSIPETSVNEASAAKDAEQEALTTRASQNLDSILNNIQGPKPPPTSAAETSSSPDPPIAPPPHLEQPRYTHHFDTYGLVKRLTGGGWENTAAITVSKAMRVILADKTHLAKQALVSKSNLENEDYLFKAACAELRTEVMSRRKSEQEKMRTERSQLQHEVDILSQRLGQESTTLKDELKGMFDDRKMAVRNEQREMESRIQQLNYRITVELQADAKSDVEALRWIMTRRVILTLGIVVLMIVGSLKAAANAMDNSKPAATPAATMATAGTQTEAAGEDGREGREVFVRQGGGGEGGYVSLG